MEEKFIAAWMQARQTAKELGVRMRPMEPSDALRQARYCLDSHRVSDGFEVLADKGRLDLTLEALLRVVDRHAAELGAEVGVVVDAEEGVENDVALGYSAEEAAHFCCTLVWKLKI